MSIERIFYPNKWFVLFCGFLVLVWLCLQVVINMNLADEARWAGLHIFNWSWPGKGWHSKAQITAVHVLHRTGSDAIVRIEGKQAVADDQDAPGLKSRAMPAVDCQATLIFYKLSGKWCLGKVELQ